MLHVTVPHFSAAFLLTFSCAAFLLTITRMPGCFYRTGTGSTSSSPKGRAASAGAEAARPFGLQLARPCAVTGGAVPPRGVAAVYASVRASLFEGTRDL